MNQRDLFDRFETLNLPELRRNRPGWTDRLPVVPERPSRVGMALVKWHWSFWLPVTMAQAYMLWLARSRYRLNLEQIEEDELDEICALDADSPENTSTVYAKHATRRETARFLVATRDAARLRRLAARWDVNAPRMIERGEVNEPAIAEVRRAIREARWTFVDRCARLSIPVLSLLVALLALLRK